MESLFCLELLVESVCIERGLLQTENETCAPQLCAAFRLLDFPTLLVYPPKALDAALETPRAPPPPPQQQLMRVPFGRGKSCIFRMCARTLRAHLSRAPLYAMLLQLGGPLPRLLGSAPLCLAGVAEHRGAHVLCDLMGREVGRLALAYRLLSLGGSLLPHLPPSRGLQLACGEGRAPAGEVGTGVAGPGSVHPAADSVVLQPLHEEGPEPQLLVISEGEAAAPLCKASVSTQTRQQLPGNPSKSLSVTGNKADLEIEANVICPPPLFYYSAAPEPKKELPVRQKAVVDEAQPILVEELVSEEECQVDSVNPTPARSDKRVKSRSRQTHSDRLDWKNTVRQLPLLNALLVELSLLNSQPVADHTCVHPQLAWLYRNVDKEASRAPPRNQSKIPTETDKLEFPEKDKRSSSPKLKTPDVLKLETSPSQKETKKVTDPDKNSKTKDYGHSTKKLFYGLTNTLRLRLQQTNPDMLILHERREQYRKKQVEMLNVKKNRNRGILSKEKRSKRSLEHMQSCRPGSGGISYQKSSFDENIKTLIQSGVENEYHESKNEIKSLPQELAAEHAVQDHIENAVSNNPLEDNTNLGSLEKSQIDPEYCREDKIESRVLLPQSVAQDYDVKSVGAKENINTFHHTVNRNVSSVGCKENSNASLPSSPEVMYSDDFVASQECTRDSDDGTSPDYTGRYSEPLDSFPKSEVNSKENPSGSDSESSMQIHSEKSVRTASISAPLPVPSTASPIQSFNRTHKLKNKHQGLAAAVTVTNENFSPERSFVEQQGQQRDKTNPSNIPADEGNNIQVSTMPGLKCENDELESDESLSIRTSQISSYLPSNISDFELSALGSTESDHAGEGKAQSGLSTLDISNQYKHITELVINQLPGYTL